MCIHCRADDHWELIRATVKNDSGELQYVVDAYTGRIVEIKPGDTKKISARLARS